MIHLVISAMLALQDAGALARRMADEDVEVREQAAKDLRALGAGALPELRRAAASADVETAGVARRLIVAIERDGKVHRAIPPPARISIEGRCRTIASLLDEVSRQVGLEVVSRDLEKLEPRDIRLTEARFGEALEALGLECVIGEDGRARVQRTTRQEKAGRQLSGPVRLDVTCRRNGLALTAHLEPGHEAAPASREHPRHHHRARRSARLRGGGRVWLVPQTREFCAGAIPARVARLRLRVTALYAIETTTARIVPGEDKKIEVVEGLRFEHRLWKNEIKVLAYPVDASDEALRRFALLGCTGRAVARHGHGKGGTAKPLDPPTLGTYSEDGRTTRFATFTVDAKTPPSSLEFEVVTDIEARTWEFDFRDLQRND